MGGLRGKAWWWELCVERWGFEDLACGVKSLCNIGQKRDEKKKKRKKHNLHAHKWGNGGSGCGG